MNDTTGFVVMVLGVMALGGWAMYLNSTAPKHTETSAMERLANETFSPKCKEGYVLMPSGLNLVCVPGYRP